MIRGLARVVRRRWRIWERLYRTWNLGAFVTTCERATRGKAIQLPVVGFERNCSCEGGHALAGAGVPLLMENVSVWAAFGVATDAKGRIVRESATSEYRLGRLVTERALRHALPERASPGVVTAIEHGFMWDNYYHWLVDCLPRVLWLWDERLRDAVGRAVTLYVCRFACGPLRDLLDAMLPSYVQVRPCDPHTRIDRATYLHLPSLARDFCGWLPQEYAARFRDAVSRIWGTTSAHSAKRLYITRRFAAKRRVLNDEEVSQKLGKLGIETVAAEHLSLPEQARLFANCALIVSAHGAGLTNALHSQRCCVVELFPGPVLGHYRELSRSLRHEYASASFGRPCKNDDFVVNTKVMIELLQALIAESAGKAH